MKDPLDNKTLDLFKYSFTSEYKAWHNMKQRCYNQNNKLFRYYGKRGITVCNSWLKFENFYRDMGRKPGQKYTLERINNNGNYEPNNCKWATWKEQNNNRRPKINSMKKADRIKQLWG